MWATVRFLVFRWVLRMLRLGANADGWLEVPSRGVQIQGSSSLGLS